MPRLILLLLAALCCAIPPCIALDPTPPAPPGDSPEEQGRTLSMRDGQGTSTDSSMPSNAAQDDLVAAEQQALATPWAENLFWDPTLLESHASMASWLHGFYANTSEDELLPPPPSQPVLKPREAALPQRNVAYYEEGVQDRHMWKQWEESSCPSLSYPLQQNQTKEYLILAPIGGSFDAAIWLNDPEYATFDVIGMYYGRNASFECPLCKAVYRVQGTKWYLMYKFTQDHPEEWTSIKNQYKAVMVADDDIEMSTCAINRIFEIFTSYELKMAQPSVCMTPYRSTWWPYLYQQSGSILRYVTFVEIMAPIFEIDMFDQFILPSLHNAYTGWGLDFCWPFLMRYPKKQIAVIDEICMLHASGQGQKAGEGNIYRVPVPYDEREEESRRMGEYGYYPSRTEAMGLPYRSMETLGIVRMTVTREEVVAADTSSAGAGAAGATSPTGAHIQQQMAVQHQSPAEAFEQHQEQLQEREAQGGMEPSVRKELIEHVAPQGGSSSMSSVLVPVAMGIALGSVLSVVAKLVAEKRQQQLLLPRHKKARHVVRV